MSQVPIKYVRMIATKHAPSHIWRWTYKVEYQGGSSKTYSEENLPARVSLWIEKERAADRCFTISEQVVSLVGWNRPAEDK